MDRSTAESLALQALAFIAADADHLARFMAETGVAEEDLRARAAEPMLLAGVLDFLLADEARLLGFCKRTGFAPERPSRARALLPGAASGT